MKDYLKRLTRGIFRYEDVKINIDTTEIKADVYEDSCTTMYFHYNSSESVKGVIWSSDERVILKDNMFFGTEGTIEYQIDTTGMYDGDRLAGTFDIISNAGEYHIAYEFTCVLKSLEASTGGIKNLYDFTNLAQQAPEEAEKIYLDDRFKSTLLRGDDDLICLYDTLSVNTNEAETIEEFLVASHQKEPVRIFTDTNESSFSAVEDETEHTVMLNKSTWGYIHADVCTSPGFVELSESQLHRQITGQDFTGSMYELGYFVKYDRLHAGNNYSRIDIRTFNQKIKYDVAVSVPHFDESEDDNLIDLKRQHRIIIMDITKCYLNYRMKKITSGEWIETTNKLIERLRGMGNDTPYYKLIQAQVMIAMGQADECEWLLDSAREEISQQNVVLYCYYLYVNSLAKKDASYTAQVCEIIKKYYENGCDDWRVLWFLFYIDKQFSHNQSVKLIRIKDAYQMGCNSPVMYFEALHILNSQPVLLRVLNRFEIQTILYGCKNHIIEESLARHISEIIGSERVASLKMIEIQKMLYAQYETDENLNVLCSQMIRNGLYGKEYISIYEKAILRGLRITRLYEYYIKSLPHDRYIRLPKIVLMFFTYDSGLDYKDTAYLYADIITNEIENAEIYDSYKAHIEQFGYEQLKLGNVDDNLLVIYRHIWNDRLIDPSTSHNMLRLMFTYRIRIYSDDIENVLVKHKELKKIERYGVKDGVAYIPMYTESCSVVFEDRNGCIHKDTLDYEKEKVLDDTSLMEIISELKPENDCFDFYRFEKGYLEHEYSRNMFDNVMRLITLQDIESYERDGLNSWLIDYYNEFYEGDDFAAHKLNINTDGLDVDKSVKLTEICIRNEDYTGAQQLIEKYGYSRVSAGLMFRYVLYWLECITDVQDDRFAGICYYIFKDRKYNEEILEYMSEFFNGNNDQMYEVWKACVDFKVECVRLEERVIAQVLFTGEQRSWLTEVFASYYKRGGNRLIIDAYTSYNSFMYFVKHKKADDIVFTAICDRLDRERDIQDICKLALLKYWSLNTENLTPQQLKTAQKLIKELCSENKCFDFFKKYSNVLILPYNILDQTVVEYYGNPEAKVCVHYHYGGEQDEHVEIMTVCSGVFVKSFTCFYGESLSYYFTEEYRNRVLKTQTYNLTGNSINENGKYGRFGSINDMLSSREHHDMSQMRKLMHGYCVRDYVTGQYFKPL